MGQLEDQVNQRIVNSDEKKQKKGFWRIWILVVLISIIVGVVWYLGTVKKEAEKTADTTTANSVGQTTNSNDKKNQNQYNWSTMDKGPYHDRVSFATGTSLTSWTDSNKILAEHASVPDAIVKEGIIHIYFVDVSLDGKAERIGHLQSSDNGKSWSDKSIISIKGLGDKVAVDPSPYLLDDGKIRLYYFDISKTMSLGLENNAMYSAISTDGINFTEEEGVRFKYRAIFDPDVIKVGSVWRMYVGTDDQKVLSATSSDGLTFTYEGVALSDGAIPNVVYENNIYYLFTGTGGIGISTSKDGKTFTKTSSRFDSGGLTADPGVAKLGENNYFMVYKTDDGTLKPKPKN